MNSDTEWEIVKKGDSLLNFQVTMIFNCLQSQVKKSHDLSKISQSIVGRIQSEIGISSWNIILCNDDVGRITFSSEQYYLVAQSKKDGLKAYIWLNKLVKKNQYEKSIVRQTEYF